MRSEALNNLAVLEIKTGDQAQAVLYFRELLALNRDDVHAIYNIATLLMDTSVPGAEGFQEAETHIARLEKLLTSSHTRVQVLRIIEATRTGRYLTALAMLKLQGSEGLESALFQGLWAELASKAGDETFIALTRYLTSMGILPGPYLLRMEQILLSKNMVREAQSLRQRSSTY